MRIFEIGVRPVPVFHAPITFSDGTTPKAPFGSWSSHGFTDDDRFHLSATGEIIRSDLRQLKPFSRASELAVGVDAPGTSTGALVLLKRQVGIEGAVEIEPEFVGAGGQHTESYDMSELLADDEDGLEEEEVVDGGGSMPLINPCPPHSQTPYVDVTRRTERTADAVRDRRTTSNFLEDFDETRLCQSQQPA